MTLNVLKRCWTCKILVILSKLVNKFIRIGENDTGRKKRFSTQLTMKCGHFADIVSIRNLCPCNYFCKDCLKPYSDKDKHSCQTHCTVFGSSDGILTGNSLSCRVCNKTCRSIDCIQSHIEEKTTKKGLSYTKCGKRYKFKTCRKVQVWEERPPELYQCGDKECVCCWDFKPEEHLCYKSVINTERKDRPMIFFDCETTQATLLQCENGNLPSSKRC